MRGVVISTSSTIISKQVEAFAAPLAVVCQRILNHVPNFAEIDSDDRPEVFRKFLSSFSFKDDFFRKCIKNCSIFAAASPKGSYATLLHAFPNIDFDSNTKPKYDHDQIFFTDHLTIDWSNRITKCILKFFVNWCVSAFLLELSKDANEDKLTEFTFIIAHIWSMVTNISDDRFYVMQTFESMRLFGKALSVISKRNFQVVQKEMIQCLGEANLSEDQLLCYFLLFSEVVIVKVIDESVIQLIARAFNIYKESKQGTLFHDSSADFLSNIITQVLLENPTLAFADPIYKEALQFCDAATTDSKSFKLVALISNVITGSEELRETKFFIANFVKSHTSQRTLKSLVEALRYKIMGKHYEPEFQLSQTHNNYKWKGTNAVSIYGNIIPWLTQNQELFESCQDELGLLFHQLAILDMKLFLTKVIPMIEHPLAMRYYRTAFFVVFRLLMADWDILCEAQPDIDRSLIDDFKRHAQGIFITVLQQYSGEEIRECKFFMVNSFTESLAAAVEPRDVALRRMILDIAETSYPVFDVHQTPADIQQELSKWMMFADPEMKTVYAESGNEAREITVNYSNVRIWTQMLKAVPFLDPEDSALKYICAIVFQRGPLVGATTLRVLQALVHRNPSYAEKIILVFCNVALKGRLDHNMLSVIIYAMKMILESARMEHTQLSMTAANAICFLAIVGFCMPSYKIRQQLLQLCAQIKESGFYLHTFLEKYETEISEDAKRRAMRAVSEIREEDLKILPTLSFSDVSQADTPNLYLFYLSSFGKYLGKFAKSIHPEFEQALISAHEILSRLLVVTSITLEKDFVIHGIALLNSCSGIVSGQEERQRYVTMRKVESIASKIAQTENTTINLIAIFSAMPSDMMNFLLPLLCRHEETFQRALAFSLREILLRDKVELNHILYTALHSAVVANVKNKLYINDICDALAIVFDKIHADNMQERNFYHSNVICGTSINSKYSSSAWFVYMRSLPEIPSTLRALTSWLRISSIPANYFDEFVAELPRLTTMMPEIGTAVLSRHQVHLFPVILEQAAGSYHMFHAISSQVESGIIKDAPHEVVLDYEDILLMIADNCGALIALCLRYMISKRAERRNEALRFLKSVITISTMVRNDKQSAVALFEHIDSIKSTLTTNFSQFLQRDLSTTNDLLALHFQFCSEQFVHECFNVIDTLTNEAKNRKSGKSVTVRVDYINVDKCYIMTDFISKWLIPFSVDLQRVGICANCEPSFQKFCIYSFIDSLMHLCDSHGMTQPLARIIDVIMKDHYQYIVICLLTLQNKSKEHLNSAILFMFYLYNKYPEKFLIVIPEMLKVGSWFFHEIQVSKVDQMFDITRFFDNRKEDTLVILDSEQTDNNSIAEYETTTSFVLQLLIECYRENSKTMKPLEPIIVAFCLINAHTVPELTSQLLSEVTGLKGNINWVLEDMIGLIPDTDEYLMAWSFCCGDLHSSVVAIKLLYLRGHVLTDSELVALWKALQTVLYILEERTNPHKKKYFVDQWLTLVIGETKPNFCGAVDYITTALKLMSRYVDNTADLSDKLLWKLMPFLDCHAPEYLPIFSEVLLIVKKYVMNDETLARITAPRDFSGLIVPILAGDIGSSQNVLHVFEIIYQLIIKDRLDLLSSTPTVNRLTCYLMIPYFIEKPLSSDLCARIAAKLGGNNEDLKQSLLEAISVETKSFKALTRFDTTCHLYVTQEDIYTTLDFYTQVAHYGSQNLREVVFAMSERILSRRDQNFSKISLLAHYAVNDQANESSEAVLGFIRALSRRNIGITNPPLRVLNWNRVLGTFPEIELYEGEVLDWVPIEGDCFAHHEDFPPLYVTDLGFIMCPWIKRIKSVIEQVKASPFTKWYDTVFLAQMQSTSLFNTPERNATVKIRPKDFFKSVKEEMEFPSHVQTNEDVEEEKVSVLDGFNVFPCDTFYPTLAEVNAIGLSTA